MANIKDLLGGDSADYKAWVRLFGPDWATARGFELKNITSAEPGVDRRAAALLLAKAKRLHAAASAAHQARNAKTAQALADLATARGSGNPDILEVSYIAIAKTVLVPGSLLYFQDTYSPTWNAEDVYGRMDPIMTFQGTPRKITIGFEVDQGTAINGVGGAVGDLIKFLYPTYQHGTATDLGSPTLSAPPLWRLKLQRNSMIGGANGFIIAVDSFEIEKFTPLEEAGEINIVRVGSAAGGLLPTKYTLKMGGYVFHEDAQPGWTWQSSGADPKAANKIDALDFPPGDQYPYGQPPTYFTTKGTKSPVSSKSDQLAALGAKVVAARAASAAASRGTSAAQALQGAAEEQLSSTQEELKLAKAEVAELRRSLPAEGSDASQASGMQLKLPRNPLTRAEPSFDVKLNLGGKS